MFIHSSGEDICILFSFGLLELRLFPGATRTAGKKGSEQGRDRVRPGWRKLLGSAGRAGNVPVGAPAELLGKHLLVDPPLATASARGRPLQSHQALPCLVGEETKVQGREAASVRPDSWYRAESNICSRTLSTVLGEGGDVGGKKLTEAPASPEVRLGGACKKQEVTSSPPRCQLPPCRPCKGAL